MNLHAPQAEAVSRQIAEEIRVEMARQKKSRRALAAVIGVSEHTAGSRIAGKNPFTSLELINVARWLGVTAVEIVVRAETQLSSPPKSAPVEPGRVA